MIFFLITLSIPVVTVTGAGFPLSSLSHRWITLNLIIKKYTYLFWIQVDANKCNILRLRIQRMLLKSEI